MLKTVSARLAKSAKIAGAPKVIFLPPAPKPTKATKAFGLPNVTKVLATNAANIIKAVAAAPAPKPQRLELSPYAHQNQYTNGQSNACGTTSLSMILNYWNPGKAANNRAVIDSKIRNGDMFTAPDDIVGYARANGYRAEIKNEASFDDIKCLLDKGVPAEVLIEPGSSTDFTLHYITVTGYEKDAAGKVTKVIVNDPAKNGRTEMSYDEFMGKWSNMKMGGVSTGMSRVLISMVPNDNRMIKGLDGVSRKASSISLPKDPWGRMFSDALPAQTLAKGWLDLVNGYKTKNAAKIAQGLAHVAASLGPTLINTLIGLPAQAAGQKLKDWGSDKMKQGGLGAIIGAAAVAMGEFTRKFGWAVSKLAAVTTWLQDKVLGTLVKVGEAVVNGVVKGVKAVAGAISDAASTAWNAAKSVGGAIVSGVKKIFSGW